MMTIQQLKRWPFVGLLGLAAVLPGVGVANAQSVNTATISFGEPPWPGVTIKTGLAAKVLQILGYKTRTRQLAVPLILSGVSKGQIDAYLGGWTPVENPLINPLVKKGEVVKLAPNISDALEGLAVPTYAWNGGVHSIADLNKHAGKFDHKIYGIGAGTGINDAVQAAIKANKAHLGKWTLVQSSTSAMLAEVTRAIRQHHWIVFLGWRPHWMNIKYSIKYLRDSDNTGTANLKSIVYTVVPADFQRTHPNVARFFKQYRIPAKVQSQWIYSYSYKKQKEKVVIRNWMKRHMGMVSQWLKGVKSTDGKPAAKVVEAYIRQGKA